MQSQSDVGTPTNGTAGLTLVRACEVHDGRGEPPTDDELEQLEEIRKLDDAVARKLLPHLQEAARVAKAASEVVGCGTHEVTKRHGKKFGKLTAQDIVEQGHRGLRGRRALDAALIQRGRSQRAPLGHEPMRRAHPAGRTPRRSRRIASRARSSRGSPRSDADEPEPPSRAASRHSLISCALEVDLLFAGAPADDLKRAGCAYCGSRTRGVRGAVLAWFLSHPCDVDEALARRNRALIRRQGGHVLEVAA